MEENRAAILRANVEKLLEKGYKKKHILALPDFIKCNLVYSNFRGVNFHDYKKHGQTKVRFLREQGFVARRGVDYDFVYQFEQDSAARIHVKMHPEGSWGWHLDYH